MEIKKYTLFYFVVVIFLIVIVMLQLLFNSVTSKNTQCRSTRSRDKTWRKTSGSEGETMEVCAGISEKNRGQCESC